MDPESIGQSAIGRQIGSETSGRRLMLQMLSMHEWHLSQAAKLTKILIQSFQFSTLRSVPELLRPSLCTVYDDDSGADRPVSFYLHRFLFY